MPLVPLVPAAGCPEQGDTRPISNQSGLFSQPSVFGQGLVTTSGANAFFAGWFVSDPIGNFDDPGRRAWFTLQGDPIAAGADRTSLKIYRTIGGALNYRLAPVSGEVGTAEIQFIGCDKLSLQYRFYNDESPGVFARLTGTLTMARVGACR
jgi:hypothetical protein